MSSSDVDFEAPLFDPGTLVHSKPYQGRWVGSAMCSSRGA